MSVVVPIAEIPRDLPLLAGGGVATSASNLDEKMEPKARSSAQSVDAHVVAYAAPRIVAIGVDIDGPSSARRLLGATVVGSTEEAAADHAF